MAARSEAAEEAFEAFAVAAWPRLRWTAYLLVGDHHHAEDLAQTALARTYAAWPRVRSADALGYARRTLVNANIDRLRRRRVTEVPVPAYDERRLGHDPNGALEERDEVVRLLAGLGSQERRVLVLRYVYDLTEAAIAEELGISRGTVKSSASRALAKLARLAPSSRAGPAIPVTELVPDAARDRGGE